MHKILVVDDDQNILNVIKRRMELENFQIFTALNADLAISKAKNEVFDLASVDLKFNGQSGIDLMQDLHTINPEMPIIILTGHGTIESAVEAMKKGACAYVTKPFDFDELLIEIRKCLEERNHSKEVKRLPIIEAHEYGLKNLIGKNKEMKKVLQQVAKAAESDSKFRHHLCRESEEECPAVPESIDEEHARKRRPSCSRALRSRADSRPSPRRPRLPPSIRVSSRSTSATASTLATSNSRSCWQSPHPNERRLSSRAR